MVECEERGRRSEPQRPEISIRNGDGPQTAADGKASPKGHHESTKVGKRERIIMIVFFVLSKFRGFVIRFDFVLAES
jgi:hypothetical protein